MEHQHNIHHRHLVDNDDICLEPRLGITPKVRSALLAALCLEHSMNGRRWFSRRLREPLCRAPGRRTEQNLQSLLFQNIYDAPDDRCLPRPGASCQHKDSVREGGDHCLSLRRGEMYLMHFFPRRNTCLGVIHVDILRFPLKCQQHPCGAFLGLVEGRRVN